MGYRTPRTDTNKSIGLIIAKENAEFEKKYGVPPDKVPMDVRNQLYEVDHPKTQVGRRFRNRSAVWSKKTGQRAYFGWRDLREYFLERQKRSQQATVEVRKLRTKRKAHARRLTHARPVSDRWDEDTD